MADNDRPKSYKRKNAPNGQPERAQLFASDLVSHRFTPVICIQVLLCYGAKMPSTQRTVRFAFAPLREIVQFMFAYRALAAGFLLLTASAYCPRLTAYRASPARTPAASWYRSRRAFARFCTRHNSREPVCRWRYA